MGKGRISDGSKINQTSDQDVLEYSRRRSAVYCVSLAANYANQRGESILLRFNKVTC